MTEYLVVWSYTLEGLVDYVERQMKDGWTCQGSVSVCTAKPTLSYETKYFQAMVR